MDLLCNLNERTDDVGHYTYIVDVVEVKSMSTASINRIGSRVMDSMVRVVVGLNGAHTH